MDHDGDQQARLAAYEARAVAYENKALILEDRLKNALAEVEVARETRGRLLAAEKDLGRCRNRLAALEAALRASEDKAVFFEKRAGEQEARGMSLQVQLAGEEARLAAVYDSLSWRITAPLRCGLAVLLKLGGRGRAAPAPRPEAAAAVPARNVDEFMVHINKIKTGHRLVQ